MTDLGCAWSINGPELLYARQARLLAARAARSGLPAGRRVRQRPRRGGVRARHAPLAAAGLSGRHGDPSVADRAGESPIQPERCRGRLLRRLLEAFESAVAQGAASTTVGGKMIDYAMAANARRVLALADAHRRRKRRATNDRGTVLGRVDGGPGVDDSRPYHDRGGDRDLRGLSGRLQPAAHRRGATASRLPSAPASRTAR